MDFSYSEEQRMVIDNLRKLLDAEIEPAFLKHGEAFIPREKMSEWNKQLREYGLMTAPQAEEWGGFGMDWLTHLMVFEEVVYSSLDVAIPGFINAVGAEFLRQFGSDEVKNRYIRGVLSGDLFISIGISEPDVGSDVAAVKTRAVRDGDDWVINGEKTWITNGERADKEAAMAKWYGTGIAVTVTRNAVQIHGGNGVTREFVVERLAREAIIAPIPDGTTEIQKLLISRALTGIQAFR